MKKRKFADGGIYTAEMGQPPMEPDGGSATPTPRRAMPKPPMKRAAPPMKRPAPKGGGVFRAGMPVPQDIDGASATPTPTPAPGMKKGGSVSARADGIAKRGRTNCKMV
jgi:hypothetical protein